MVMAASWMHLALMQASVLALVRMSFGLGWAHVLALGDAGPRPHPDLLALGLDRMPPSWGDLRRAYRSAARKAHPGCPWRQRRGVPGRRGSVRKAVGEAGQAGGVDRPDRFDRG